jgi:hypothetical protein
LLVFPEFGKADYELTASVLSQLIQPKNGIQLARHTQEELISIKRQLESRLLRLVSTII